VADHRDVAETEVLPGVVQQDRVGAAGRTDEGDVRVQALDLVHVGAEVLRAQRLPQLLDDLTAGRGERADEPTAALPAEGVVGAEGDRPAVARLVRPRAGREARLAAGVAGAQDVRVELPLREVVGAGDVQGRDALAGDVVGDRVRRVRQHGTGDEVDALAFHQTPGLGQRDVRVPGVVLVDGADGDPVDRLAVQLPVEVPAALHVRAEGGGETGHRRYEADGDGVGVTVAAAPTPAASDRHHGAEGER